MFCSAKEMGEKLTKLKVNSSLASFSGFIQGAVIGGIALLLLGAVVFGNNLTGGSMAGLSWGIIFCYLGSGLLGLSILGSFLRQTARVIVEGLDGNLNESDDNGHGYRSGSKLDKLTFKQQNAWVEAGKPDIDTWDGEGPSFDDWLENHSK